MGVPSGKMLASLSCAFTFVVKLKILSNRIINLIVEVFSQMIKLWAKNSIFSCKTINLSLKKASILSASTEKFIVIIFNGA